MNQRQKLLSFPDTSKRSSALLPSTAEQKAHGWSLLALPESAKPMRCVMRKRFFRPTPWIFGRTNFGLQFHQLFLPHGHASLPLNEQIGRIGFTTLGLPTWYSLMTLGPRRTNLRPGDPLNALESSLKFARSVSCLFP